MQRFSKDNKDNNKDLRGISHKSRNSQANQ